MLVALAKSVVWCLSLVCVGYKARTPKPVAVPWAERPANPPRRLSPASRILGPRAAKPAPLRFVAMPRKKAAPSRGAGVVARPRANMTPRPKIIPPPLKPPRTRFARLEAQFPAACRPTATVIPLFARLRSLGGGATAMAAAA